MVRMMIIYVSNKKYLLMMIKASSKIQTYFIAASPTPSKLWRSSLSTNSQEFTQ